MDADFSHHVRPLLVACAFLIVSAQPKFIPQFIKYVHRLQLGSRAQCR